MAENRGVVYVEACRVEVHAIPFPKPASPQGRHIEHGVILRVVSTSICGSDQHMVLRHEFDAGAPKKFLIDPHRMFRKAA